MKSLKNLRKVIRELNAPIDIDGEKFERGFEFKIKKEGDSVLLYDCNERYHADYAYESFCLMRQAAAEFGFDPPKEYDDDIYNKLNEALKKDLGNDAFIEWEDHVRMCICEG